MNAMSIMQYLSNGMAAKRPSWGGYIRRDDTIDESGDIISSKITIVRRNGDQYVFRHTTSDDSFEYLGFIAAGPGNTLGTSDPVKSVKLDLEEEMFEATFFSEDWISATAESFEKSRSGSGIY